MNQRQRPKFTTGEALEHRSTLSHLFDRLPIFRKQNNPLGDPESALHDLR
jgi:hypothetical protein